MYIQTSLKQLQKHFIFVKGMQLPGREFCKCSTSPMTFSIFHVDSAYKKMTKKVTQASQAVVLSQDARVT